MKGKVIGSLTLVLILCAAIFANHIEHDEGKALRVHQHRTERKDQGCQCNKEELCSHLPVIVMDTHNQEIPGKPTDKADRFGEIIYTKTDDGTNYIDISLSIIDNKDKNNHPSDAPKVVTKANCRIRGHAARQFDKKSYLLKFIDDQGNDCDYPVMGMPNHNEWILNGPIYDKSMIRNYMWCNISGEIMEYAPNVRFCELIQNGEYKGIYLMMESITNGDGCRLNLKENVKNSETMGYLLRLDRSTEDELDAMRNIYTFSERVAHVKQDISIRYPGKNKLTEYMAEEIEQEYSAYEKCLFSFDYDTEKYGYWNWIDVDSYVDYFIINEFTKNMDAGNYSTYIYKELGEKYKLCVWDFNHSCDNAQEEEMSPYDFTMTEKPLFVMLCKDEKFTDKVIERYKMLRKTYLSDQYLEKYIEECTEYLGPALERNHACWKNNFETWLPLKPVDRNTKSQKEDAKRIKDWLIKRGRWLDHNIQALKANSHFSRNKAYNH